MNLSSFSTFKPRGSNGQFIIARVDEAVLKAISGWANKVLDSAKSFVPVDTGELRDSGHVVISAEGNKVAAAVVFDAPHSVFVEFGTGQRGAASPGAGDGPYSESWAGMPATPYLRPAFDENRNQAVGLVREQIVVELK